MRAQLFDIQRCSLVDGPGLRTTVFFKGCNLRCLWCHNPESQYSGVQMMIHKNRCKGCGRCAKICPNHLEKCDFCGKCADYCPGGAREIVGKSMSADEILREVMKDRSYYEGTGGGVTFSGGECMLQMDVLCELLKKCREEGIHTALDTAGNVPREHFESVLPMTDLFLFDIKCADPELHKAVTGVSNERILSNLAFLCERVPDRVTVRIPVIPGVNTSDEEMAGIARILSENSVRTYELLPYHRMGEHKYEDLGLPLHAFEVPSSEEMERCRRLLCARQ